MSGERWHGTAGGYKNHGCRLECCREAHAVAQAAQKARRERLPWDQIPHGTVNGYVNYHCRCEDCRDAKKVADAEAYMQRKGVGGFPSP